MIKDTPAFPQVDLKDAYGMLVPDRQSGMTLRDWFAGKAMQSLVLLVQSTDVDLLSKQAYVLADAMLKERSK